VKPIEPDQVPPDVIQLLEQARHENLMIRLEDGSEFLVVAIDDFDEEIERTRGNPKLMTLLEERARQTTTIPLDEVKRRLGL
jgi:hypothetical protein